MQYLLLIDRKTAMATYKEGGNVFIGCHNKRDGGVFYTTEQLEEDAKGETHKERFDYMVKLVKGFTSNNERTKYAVQKNMPY